MSLKKVGKWREVRRIVENLERDAKVALEVTLNRLGLFYVAEIQKGIVSQAPAGQAFEELKPATMERKGSTKALIDHGDLMGGVTYKVLGKTRGLFVGLLRQARGRSDQPLANVGEIMEMGTRDGKTPPRAFVGPIAASRTIRAKAVRLAEDTFGKTLKALR